MRALIARIIIGRIVMATLTVGLVACGSESSTAVSLDAVQTDTNGSGVSISDTSAADVLAGDTKDTQAPTDTQDIQDAQGSKDINNIVDINGQTDASIFDISSDGGPNNLGDGTSDVPGVASKELGKWVVTSSLNTMYLFDGKVRYTYLCTKKDCTAFWNSCKAGDANALPNPNTYSLINDDLEIDLNFGNIFSHKVQFLCDNNVLQYSVKGGLAVRWHRPNYDFSKCSN